jgi:hypothetical protein
VVEIDDQSPQRGTGMRPAISARFSTSPARVFGRSIVREAHETAAEWRAQHREALTQWGRLHPDDEAARLAMGAMEVRWHMRHGERVPPNLCAGCRRPIGEAEALDLIDGSRVHIADQSDCLLRHGERWRRAATRALVELGLQPPESAP